MEEKKQIQENKMGVMPINPLLISMALPMIVSMMVQALYNIVDSMFVAQINENALTAVSLAFPVQNLMIAVASGTGVGVNTLLSRSLGQRRFDKANKAATNGIFLVLISYVIFLIIGITASDLFFRSQTGNKEILAYGSTYMRIVCLFSIAVFFQITLERLLQSTGKTFYTMITQSVGAVINIIMDPILIFGLFGFPQMGVAGAAIATVFGQIVGSLLALYFNIRKNKEINLNMKGFRPDPATIKEIYAVGIPSIIMISIGSIMTFGMNKILIAFSTTAAAVFGVYFKLQSFIFMPVFGLNNGMVPIVSYNFGAGNKDRILKVIKLSVAYAMAMMGIGVGLFVLLPVPLLRIFNASDNMLAIGVPALRIISIHFVLAGFSIIGNSVCQALSHGFISLIISMVRQLFVLLPAAWILSESFGLGAVWFAFPIAEVVAVVITALALKYLYEKEIKILQRIEK